MKDFLLNKAFLEEERWKTAIQKGLDKDICKKDLLKLTDPNHRADLYRAIRRGEYVIAPPRAEQIPKDNGETRTVYINTNQDRVLLSLFNDLLFDVCGSLVHPACKSYRKGIGHDSVVVEASRMISLTGGRFKGFKADLSKFFDSVGFRYIDEVFDKVEQITGKSSVIDLLRRYYHDDRYMEKGEEKRKFQSLKQGCSVASFLADAVLRHIDEKMSGLSGFYVRYSDDILYIGVDATWALALLKDELTKMDLVLNPKKVETLSPERWFKFLGYSIRGKDISLSETRIKKFQKEIERRTVNAGKTTPERALRSVLQFLYVGDGEFSWATQVLRTCNVQRDLDLLNAFTMDCLRAVETGRKKIGGLGYLKGGREGCIFRGKGADVKGNRNRTGHIQGYRSLRYMQNALRAGSSVYGTIIRTMPCAA